MNGQYTRRDILVQGAAFVGLATAEGLRAVHVTAAQRQAKAAPSLPVAIERCASYEPQLVTAQLKKALDSIGGIKKMVRGKTVTVKLNLTGGPRWKLGGLPSYRTYHVHPNFVAATCALLHDAGAKRIVLVESSYDARPLEAIMGGADWDITGINSAGGGKVQWEDTRNKGAWPAYSRLSVPWGGYIYPAFDLNMRYEKTDVFVSLAKLKDHANAGITVSVKNLFGIAPTSIYGDNFDGAGKPSVNEESITARGDTFHRGTRQPPAGAPQELDPKSSRLWSHRVPCITSDLFGARPVDLCLVDGIETNRGGEGPWIKGVQPIQPHLLFAGRNGVCTDAICAAAMGYDPTADHEEFPFMGENHLALLADRGIGTNVVKEIEVCGLALKNAIHPFNPTRRQVGLPIFQ
jgi:uncharacterized protein (DUF362 family)